MIVVIILQDDYMIIIITLNEPLATAVSTTSAFSEEVSLADLADAGLNAWTDARQTMTNTTRKVVKFIVEEM